VAAPLVGSPVRVPLGCGTMEVDAAAPEPLADTDTLSHLPSASVSDAAQREGEVAKPGVPPEVIDVDAMADAPAAAPARFPAARVHLHVDLAACTIRGRVDWQVAAHLVERCVRCLRRLWCRMLLPHASARACSGRALH
jgi:hypothetical protein